jgi:hypothetical protein
VPSIETIEALIEQSYDANPTQKIELLQSAVNIADALGDVELGFETRSELMDAAVISGRPELLFVAFAWMLAQFDAGRVDEHQQDDLLWKYKWVINTLWEFPSITAAQIDASFKDFSQRLERSGYNSRTAHYFRWKYELHRGDLAAAERQRNAWQAMSKDDLSDCTACEAHFDTVYQSSIGQHELALERAAPILSKRMQCAEVPHTTYGALLKTLLHLERLEQAADAHHRGYRMTRDNPEFLISVSQHLEFLAFTHNIGAAVTLLERHLPWALETTALERRFEFYRALQPLWARLSEIGETRVKLRAPQDFALQADDDTFEVSALELHFRAELERIAAQFDTRNGTNAFATQIGVDQRLLERTPHLPISDERRKTRASRIA